MGKIDWWACVKVFSVGVLATLLLLMLSHYALGFSTVRLAAEPNQQRRVTGFFLYDYKLNDDVRDICQRRSLNGKYGALMGEDCWKTASKDLEGRFGTWITTSKTESNSVF